MLASGSGYLDCVRFLIDRSASVDAVDEVRPSGLSFVSTFLFQALHNSSGYDIAVDHSEF